MFPILYRNDEREFTSNGLGRLSECISCIVTEERNGIYECEFTYPITGRFYKHLHDNGGIIGVIHDDRHDIQPFDIYKFSAPIDGVVKFNAHHISYRLSNVIVDPFEAESCTDALQGLKSHSISTNPFTFWTNKPTTGTFTVKHPDALRALLGGQEGSILDVYGAGDYQFNKFEVRLYANRGSNTGVTIRYGKNLTDILHERDESTTFSAVAPYWQGESETVYLPEGYIIAPSLRAEMFPWTDENGNPITGTGGETIEFNAPIITPAPLDMTSYFEEAPTVEELRQAAADFMERNQPWKPSENITVDFVQLWQTPEYESVATLQRVALCDTVSVYYPELGVIQAEEKVIKTVYNVLLERYDSIELGELRTSFAEAIQGSLAESIESLSAEIMQSSDTLRHYIDDATTAITGGLGGYVVFTLNANKEPQEILIMDTPDINTAVNVWRWNQGGLGHSHSGYAGPFDDIAITQDGKINASMIATGYLLASYIRGGTLTLGGYDNVNGVLQILDANGNAVTTGNKSGITTTRLVARMDSNNKAEFNSNGMSIHVEDSTVGNGKSTYYNLPDGTAYEHTVGDFRWQTTPNGWVVLSSVDPYRFLTMASQNGETKYLLSMSCNNGIEFDVGTTAMFVVTASGDVMIRDGLRVFGTKNRVVETNQYGNRLLYCYETPSPLFGDVGEGEIAEDGACYVWLDPVFAQTIATDQYQVFLQKYGEGDCYVAERHPGYFVVNGTSGLAFGWEIKAKQADFDQRRLDKNEELELPKGIDYGAESAAYIENLFNGRLSA